MLIRTLELQNFRQFKDQKIEFATLPEKNVTLIIGDNKAGKTTISQSFFWCLYGDTSFADKSMLNKEVESELHYGSSKYVKVTISLVHRENEYKFKRIQEYKKHDNGRIRGMNAILEGSKIIDGVTKPMAQSQVEEVLKEILPKELSRYFFFDGERIEKMSKEISSGRKSYEFAEAVNGLLGLNTYKEAIRYLGPTMKNSVIGFFNSQFDGSSDSKIKKLSNQIEESNYKMNTCKNNLIENQKKIDNCKDLINKIESDLRSTSKGEELHKRKKNIEKEVETLERSLKFSKTQTFKKFNQSYLSYFAKPLYEKAISMIENEEMPTDNLPDIHSDLINDILDAKKCLCGNVVEAGNDAFNTLVKLLEFLPPHSIGIALKEFEATTNGKLESCFDLNNQITDTMGNIGNLSEALDEQNNELYDIEKEYMDPKLPAKINSLKSQLLSTKKDLSSFEFKRSELERKYGAAESSIKSYEGQRKELVLKDESNQKNARYKDIADEVFERLNFTYKLQENKIRTELTKKINEIYSRFFDDEIVLKIDDLYKISIHYKGNNSYNGVIEASTAQSIAVIFSFILGVIDIARNDNEREKDYELLLSEAYPFILDAPLSAFDKTRIQAVCSQLPVIAEQVIIMIKDTDGDLADEHMSEFIGKRYRINKLQEVHSKLEGDHVR